MGGFSPRQGFFLPSLPPMEKTLNSFTAATNAVSWRRENTDREQSADEPHKFLI